MTRRSTAPLVWGIWGFSLVLVVFAAVFLVLALPGQDQAEFGFPGYAILFSLALGGVGFLIALRRPANPIGWLFLGPGAVVAASVEFGRQYAIYTLDVSPGALAGGEYGAWAASWIWVLAFSAFGLALLFFPDGHLPSPRWRPAAAIAVVLLLVSASVYALVPGPLESYRRIDNPFGVRALDGTYDAAGVPIAIVMSIVAASLVVRRRRASGDERAQLRWVAFAASLLPVAFVFLLVATALLGRSPIVDLIETLVILALLGIPIAVGIAILKYRLYDIEIVINRALVLALLAGFITVVYVGVVVGVGAAIGQRGDPILSAIAAALVALAFQPVRRWAHHAADRFVYGERATPYEVLSAFSERLAATYETDDVLPRMAMVVGEGTGADRATVWLRIGDELRPVATWPADEADGEPHALDRGNVPRIPDASVAAAVRHRGELLGALTVTKPPSEPVTSTEEKLLDDVAHQAGFVLRNVRLVQELRESRQRLVAAQDDERRKLERDLHDGAQQQLVALAVKLRLAESMVGSDSGRERALLMEIREESQEALDALRDLARGIYPPVLADRGLKAALEGRARKAPMPVTVEADGIGRYPQVVEATAYFCALEAVQNAAKYAEASQVRIRLGTEDGHLLFEVTDDGRGFDPATTSKGAGLRNMLDRLDAVGGRLEVRSQPGAGTSVAGRIPVRDGPSGP